ncbi:DUF2218 domain-containing protein [Martelella radicis]|uniref:NADPH-dependent ferric siderophore reductase n=1 Tax=Martelella radicis TaxID=1397476 RepID=A0A7W6KLX6_9HYPH|nr:DUF2218 domain-containing protein [Martelella radicis]MBB4123723.1 NADPH-dependent ferric siderophore reductase [Martelella radicis]
MPETERKESRNAMVEPSTFTLSGVAVPRKPAAMLDLIAEHFAEHAEVERDGGLVTLKSAFGVARIETDGEQLDILLSAASEGALQLSRTMLAEHMFYFAGDEKLALEWSMPPAEATPSNLCEAVVVSTETVTPHMVRVIFSCGDVHPYVGGNMHVRLLVPPKGREPVWPVVAGDGRIKWPEGEDALLVRVYTIRRVDVDRREVSVDFLQHPAADIATPGADFARDARPGDRVAFLGPGGGVVPEADKIFLVGDEAALPAIARIAEEVPAGTRLSAIIEVENETEEQPISSAGDLELRWLHRSNDRKNAMHGLADAAKDAIAGLDRETFVWIACEKADVRDIRRVLKERQHDRKMMYVAWYWERGKAATG